MKKPLLVGGISILTVLFSLTVQTASSNAQELIWVRSQSAYFTWGNQQLAIVPEIEPVYASVLPVEDPNFYTQEELEPIQNTVESLLSTGFVLHVEDQSFSFPAQMKDLVLEKSNGDVQLYFTPEFTNYILKTVGTAMDVPSQDWHLLEADETKTSRVTFEGFIADGKELVPTLTEEMIEAALHNKKTEATGVMRVVEGRIVNETGKDLGPLEFLAEGKSSFWGSSPERGFNIRKAINERFNGILIPPGGEFSYVEFLGEIEYAGWKQAYTIFKGTSLEKAPAGGVCQISTTVYRAALDAAFEITEQRNHSLYVIYYQHFGDGLDATVYPGEQDLKFVNNTSNYVLMVAQEEGYEEAVIRFYGEPDGRSTELYGPYTASTQTDEVIEAVGNRLGIGQIAWKYVITHPDGTVEVKWLVSNYMSPTLQHRGETPGLLEY